MGGDGSSSRLVVVYLSIYRTRAWRQAEMGGWAGRTRWDGWMASEDTRAEPGWEKTGDWPQWTGVKRLSGAMIPAGKARPSKQLREIGEGDLGGGCSGGKQELAARLHLE